MAVPIIFQLQSQLMCPIRAKLVTRSMINSFVVSSSDEGIDEAVRRAVIEYWWSRCHKLPFAEIKHSDWLLQAM